jgi:ABC-2 type transport system ATP-binding protein
VTAAIRTKQLTRYYGKTAGIIDLDLEVQVGEVFGFLGPNGAGKTTTIRTLMDIIRPTSGSATLLGFDSKDASLEARRRIGFLPGDLEMYETMTARQMCEFFGGLRDVDVTKGMEMFAERLDLDLDKTIGSYSSGNRQKVGIVQAFMHEPELLILDEPSLGLDPLIQQEFYRMLDEVRFEGRTVFLCSHFLPEVERVADRVGIVRNSRLIAVETVEGLKAKATRRFEFIFTERVPVEEFTRLPSVTEAHETNGGSGVAVSVVGSVDALLKTAARYDTLNVISKEGDLESAFLAFYEEEDADA